MSVAKFYAHHPIEYIQDHGSIKNGLAAIILFAVGIPLFFSLINLTDRNPNPVIEEEKRIAPPAQIYQDPNTGLARSKYPL